MSVSYLIYMGQDTITITLIACTRELQGKLSPSHREFVCAKKRNIGHETIGFCSTTGHFQI